MIGERIRPKHSSKDELKRTKGPTTALLRSVVFLPGLLQVQMPAAGARPESSDCSSTKTNSSMSTGQLSWSVCDPCHKMATDLWKVTFVILASRFSRHPMINAKLAFRNCTSKRNDGV